jgi:uncharacterized protein (DUF305 family)
MGGNLAFDQGYMRRMTAHHAQGVELGLLAAERAQNSQLRTLARLMAAGQKAEIVIFNQWWRSWFGGALPPATDEDHAAMPGMVSAEEMTALRQVEPDAFDARFVAAMTFHHRGAIIMADEALRKAGDLRLRLMSHAIRHEQRGEIELMQGSRGFAAVRAAVLNMLLPAGAAPPDRGPALQTAALVGPGAVCSATPASVGEDTTPWLWDPGSKSSGPSTSGSTGTR